MRLLSMTCVAAAAVRGIAAYWMEDIAHQGVAPYHPDPDYQVFRNVRDFGAVGDGVTDDTAAINLAISSGDRCAPHACNQSTIAPATVYFPAGTYLVSDSIINYYYTQIIGDAAELPVIKASADFPTETTLGVIDANPYGDSGLAWMAVNVFFRQIHNLIIDTTAIPASASALGLHWPSSQATSLSNLEFRLAAGNDTRHVGLFSEEGSGGLFNDLTFRGGAVGANFGNQQYTARNLRFYGCGTAIRQLWDWGWTYKSLVVEDCDVGIDMVDENTASITMLDSEFTRVGDAVRTARRGSRSTPKAAGSLVMENVRYSRVKAVLRGPDGVIVPGDPDGQMYIQGYADGHVYDPYGPTVFAGSDSTYFPRPAALLDGDKYYEKSKPTYVNVPASNFVSIRTFGASGDGTQDATSALNRLFAHVAGTDLIAFIDAGFYVVTDTVTIPPGARVVGEALASVIVGTGPLFSDMSSPRAVVRVGEPGNSGGGRVEWSDTIVTTRGPAAGAVVVEYNLYTAASEEPSGMWDVHVRIGGFAGTDLQLAQCPTASGGEADAVNPACVAAHTSMHVTRGAAGLFSENCWLWVADHDLEDRDYSQITIFAGRGLLVESREGRIFVSASGSEHHVLYQYQLLGTRDVYMGQVQSETPYFQPNPPASVPFPPVAAIRDPDFTAQCEGAADADAGGVPCEMAWGLRVLGSRDVVIYGAGLYSFFNDYSTDCCQPESGTECQQRIFEIDDAEASSSGAGTGDKTAAAAGSKGCGVGGRLSGLGTYNLNTVGTVRMVTRYGEDVALAADNTAGFVDTVAVYHHGLAECG